MPDGAILAGHDQDQSPMYIGRAWHEGDQLPGEQYFFLFIRKFKINQGKTQQKQKFQQFSQSNTIEASMLHFI